MSASAMNTEMAMVVKASPSVSNDVTENEIKRTVPERAMNTEMAMVLWAPQSVSNDVMETEIDSTELSTSMAEQAPPGEFYFFPKLPLELRQMVWKFAANSSRFLALSDFGLAKISHIDLEDRSPTIQTIKNSPPAVLHVCQESRNECLKLYKPIFGGKIDPTIFSLPAGPTKLMDVSASYLNPGSDTLWISSRYCEAFFWGFMRPREDLKLVQSIAFDIEDVEEIIAVFDEPLDVMRDILIYRQIEEIILVLPYEEEDVDLDDLELVPAYSGFDQQSIDKAVSVLEHGIQAFKAEIEEIAKARYLSKPHPDAIYGQPQNGYVAGDGLLSDHMGYLMDLEVLKEDFNQEPEREENPSEDALRKFAEEVDYTPPEIKVMELIRREVRRGA